MLISVIISLYNGASYIEKCVQSFLAQTYREMEIILYDDASTDDTWQVLQQLSAKYPETIRVYHGTENKGPGGGKTEGLRHAMGEYVYFADCDDYVSDTHLEKFAEAAKMHEYPDIVIGGITRVNTSGIETYSRHYKNKETALYQSFTDYGKIFRLEYLKGNFLYLPSGRILEDILFHAANVLSHPKVAVCNEAGYYYVQNMQSITNTTLKKFVPHALDQEFQYLAELKQRVKTPDDSELLTYYAFRCVCWHLLKSGAHVGKQAMLAEYGTAMRYMEQYFPNFRKCRYISWFRPKYERGILRFVVGTVGELERLRLAKPFFVFYSCVDLSYFWPNM